MGGMLTDPGNSNELTRTIIGCAIEVHREIGLGLLESAYKACMVMELRRAGLDFEVERPFPPVYKGTTSKSRVSVGPDGQGADHRRLEMRLRSALIHTAQILTYLRLANSPV